MHCHSSLEGIIAGITIINLQYRDQYFPTFQAFQLAMLKLENESVAVHIIIIIILLLLYMLY